MIDTTITEIRNRHNNLQTWANAYGGILPDKIAYITANFDRGILLEKLEEAQAKIDLLMLEYCPEDMTEDQMETWKENQVEATDAEEIAFADALKTTCN